MIELTESELTNIQGGFWQALLVVIAGIGAYSSAKELGADIGSALGEMESPLPLPEGYYSSLPAGVQ